MKDRELEAYEVLYGGCIMGLPLFLCPEGNDWRVLLFFLASLALFVISAKIKSILIYLAVWAATGVFFMRTGVNILEQCCILGGVILGGIGYFWGRWKGNAGFFSGPEYGALAIPAVVYAVAWFQEISYLKGRACLFAAAVFLLRVLSGNRAALILYLKENEKLHRFPGKRLEKRNRFVMGALALLISAVMVLAYVNAPADPAKPEARQVTVKETEFQEYVQPQTEMNLDELFGGELQEERVMPEWLKKLGNIIYNVLLFGVFGGLLAAVIYGLYRIASGYRGQFANTAARKTVGEEDVTEDLAPPKFSVSRMFKRRTPEEQVRRIYKKWVLNGPGQVPGAALSPEEAEKAAEVRDEEIHEVYEKVRYGGKKCGGEEIERMRRRSRGR